MSIKLDTAALYMKILRSRGEIEISASFRDSLKTTAPSHKVAPRRSKRRRGRKVLFKL